MCKQYLLCIAITMLALSIARALVIIILFSNVKEVHANKPQLNIFDVGIMHGYPRDEWAGILVQNFHIQNVELWFSVMDFLDVGDEYYYDQCS